MTLNWDDAVKAMDAAAPSSSMTLSGWSIDTRTLQKGDLFFALRGPNHDGHEHVAEAVSKGAAGVVVDRDVDATAPQLLVKDSLAALQNVSRWTRRNWGGTVVGVTGSAGKTTTKDVIAHLLAVDVPVGKTIGNLNNEIGVPLSILRLPDGCRAGVIEMGMNHAGEIRRICQWAEPNVGVVTNVGHAHAEFFDDGIEGVALAKRELIDSLGPSGVAVLNADDPRVSKFRDAHPGKSITFGMSDGADIRGEQVEYSATGASFHACGVEFETGLVGRHGVLNILAGIAVAQVFGIAPERLREAAATFTQGKMRGERLEWNGVTILNDCYNSNPEAAKAMLDVLSAAPAQRRIAILGEMRELGRSAENLHRGVGKYAAERGIDVLIGIHGAARHMVDEAVRAGLSGGAALFFDDPIAAGEFAKTLVKPGDAVLFKGSRGVQVERALERLVG